MFVSGCTHTIHVACMTVWTCSQHHLRGHKYPDVRPAQLPTTWIHVEVLLKSMWIWLNVHVRPCVHTQFETVCLSSLVMLPALLGRRGYVLSACTLWCVHAYSICTLYFVRTGTCTLLRTVSAPDMNELKMHHHCVRRTLGFKKAVFARQSRAMSKSLEHPL